MIKIIAPALAVLLGFSVLKTSLASADTNVQVNGSQGSSQEEIHESAEAQIHEHENENKSPEPSESPEPSQSPEASVSPSPIPSVSPTPIASSSPSASPSISPSASPSPSATPTVFAGLEGQTTSLQDLINAIINFFKGIRS